MMTKTKRSNERGNFPENLFGNCGRPPEIVLFFRSGRNSRNATICQNSFVSRPFLTRSSKICGMECCVVNGKRHSHPVVIKLVIPSGFFGLMVSTPGRCPQFPKRFFRKIAFPFDLKPKFPDFLAKW